MLKRYTNYLYLLFSLANGTEQHQRVKYGIRKVSDDERIKSHAALRRTDSAAAEATVVVAAAAAAATQTALRACDADTSSDTTPRRSALTNNAATAGRKLTSFLFV